MIFEHHQRMGVLLPVKAFQIVRKFATTKKFAKMGQNFVCLRSWALFASPKHVALFDVTISNCCPKGIIGGIISFRDKQCIMNYNQNNSFVDNTLALGKKILEQSYSGLTTDFLICKYFGTELSKQTATKTVHPHTDYCSQLWICKRPAHPDDHLQKAGPSEWLFEYKYNVQCVEVAANTMCRNSCKFNL